jgi:hypothetical protein
MLGLTLKGKKGILSGWRILNSEFRMGKGNWEGGDDKEAFGSWRLEAEKGELSFVLNQLINHLTNQPDQIQPQYRSEMLSTIRPIPTNN